MTTPHELRELAAQWRGVSVNARAIANEMRDRGVGGAAMAFATGVVERANATATMLDERAAHLENAPAIKEAVRMLGDEALCIDCGARCPMSMALECGCQSCGSSKIRPAREIA